MSLLVLLHYIGNIIAVATDDKVDVAFTYDMKEGTVNGGPVLWLPDLGLNCKLHFRRWAVCWATLDFESLLQKGI